nr:MAG TPA: hypothetical protein [Caudoviricetes sp.]
MKYMKLYCEILIIFVNYIKKSHTEICLYSD